MLITFSLWIEFPSTPKNGCFLPKTLSVPFAKWSSLEDGIRQLHYLSEAWVTSLVRAWTCIVYGWTEQWKMQTTLALFGLSPVTSESVTKLSSVGFFRMYRDPFHGPCLLSQLKTSKFDFLLPRNIDKRAEKIKCQLLLVHSKEVFHFWVLFWVVQAVEERVAIQRLRVAELSGSWLNSFLCSSCKSRMSALCLSILPWVKRNPEFRSVFSEVSFKIVYEKKSKPWWVRWGVLERGLQFILFGQAFEFMPN